MKPFIILFFLILSFHANAAQYFFIETAEQSFEGELLEAYDDRWFHEAEDASRGQFELYFLLDHQHPQFKLVEKSQIISNKSSKEAESQYFEFMQTQGLRFQEHPVKNAVTLTGHEGHHKYERMFGNFAWDIGIKVDDKQFSNEGKKNQDYYIFGKDVLFPFDGEVIVAVGNAIDNPPDLSLSTTLPSDSGNYVIIKVAENIYVSMVHFQKDSLLVQTGDKVKAGQMIGKVGNSGVSYLPHLHYTFYAYIKELDRYISIP